MLLLELILDDGSVEETIEGVQKLELANDGIAVIETLGENGSKSSLEFLDALAELVEVVIEGSLFNVHDVVGDLHELLDGNIELSVDLDDGVGKSLTLGVTDLNLLKLLELDHSVGQVHDVLASLLEGIQSNKESVLSDFPLTSDLSLVLMVGLLELGAGIKSLLKS